MANRVPLIVDTSTLNIKELPAGDSLDLTNSGIVNAGVITASSFSGNISGTPTLGTGVTITSSGINVTGVITASNGFSGDLTGDVTGAATQVTLADESSDTTCFPIFATGATGNLAPKTGTNLTFNSSTGDLTVGGNVSVGGTLTYQDVRNVDSLGIVTARNGLRVTAGGINVTAGISTFGGAIDANGTLDVDGQTDLDVLNVAETATFSALVDVNNRIDIVGGANVDQVNVTGVSTYAGTAKFDGTIDANGLIDADGGANIVGGLTVDQVNVSGVSTYGGNVDINANVDVSGTSTFQDDANFNGTGSGISSAFWDKSANEFKFKDNVKLSFGDSQDLTAYHVAGHTWLKNTTGYLRFASNGSGFTFSNIDNSQAIAQFVKGGSCDLYHNNGLRVQTTSDGTDFGGTGAVGITKGTTGQRPGSPAAGDFRYNTSTEKFEGYTTKWGAIGGGSEEVDNIVSQTTATGVGTMSAAENRAASIRALIQQGTNYQVGRYLMIHDNSTVTVVEESAVATGGSMLGSFDGVISGSNAVLRVTMVSAASTAVVTTLIDKITI